MGGRSGKQITTFLKDFLRIRVGSLFEHKSYLKLEEFYIFRDLILSCQAAEECILFIAVSLVVAVKNSILAALLSTPLAGAFEQISFSLFIGILKSVNLKDVNNTCI